MNVIRLPRYDGRIATVAGIMTPERSLLRQSETESGNLLPLYCLWVHHGAGAQPGPHDIRHEERHFTEVKRCGEVGGSNRITEQFGTMPEGCFAHNFSLALRRS